MAGLVHDSGREEAHFSMARTRCVPLLKRLEAVDAATSDHYEPPRARFDFALVSALPTTFLHAVRHTVLYFFLALEKTAVYTFPYF